MSRQLNVGLQAYFFNQLSLKFGGPSLWGLGPRGDFMMNIDY